jgi:hypothetical protein
MGIFDKIKDNVAFATEDPESEDFGKDRESWNKAKGKDTGK